MASRWTALVGWDHGRVTTFEMPKPHPVINVLLALNGSRKATVELTTDSLAVRLGLTWSATIPRSSITAADRDPLRTISIGAHGWAGNWLVNTSTKGLVALTIDPEVRGRCFGFPIKLRRLHLSLADPDAFLTELNASPA
jgi:hypothetical protein